MTTTPPAVVQTLSPQLGRIQANQHASLAIDSFPGGVEVLCKNKLANAYVFQAVKDKKPVDGIVHIDVTCVGDKKKYRLDLR